MVSSDVLTGVAGLLISTIGLILTIVVISFRLGARISSFQHDIDDRLTSISNTMERNNTELRSVSESLSNIDIHLQNKAQESFYSVDLLISGSAEEEGNLNGQSGESSDNITQNQAGKQRLTLRIPKEQIEKLDQLVESGEYPSRTAALRQSVLEMLDISRNQEDE